MTTLEIELVLAGQASPAQGGNEHASERASVRARARAGGNDSMGRLSERAR
jgi:hypothetical protein